MSARDAGSRTGAFLHCPRCGFSIRLRVPWLGMEHCPRCMARARTPVKLSSSPQRGSRLDHKDAAPGSN